MRTLLSIFGLVLLFSTYASASDITPLAAKINQRLSYMKDVAGVKAQRHLPIEDLAQESKVLATTQAEAAKLGPDPLSIKPFIVAQMDAAKAIQYRYRADWLTQAEIGWQPRALDEIRPDIAHLSREILQQVAQQLKTGAISESERRAFINTIRQTNLSDADKQRLFNTLLMVKTQ